MNIISKIKIKTIYFFGHENSDNICECLATNGSVLNYDFDVNMRYTHIIHEPTLHRLVLHN